MKNEKRMKHGRIFLFVTIATAFIAESSSEFCTQPPERGPCLQRITRWYWDLTVQKCLKFNYGGCFGNENNFKSRKECKFHCKTRLSLADQDSACLLRSKSEKCRADTPNSWQLVWYFDVIEKRCRQFQYTGCGGNANRFLSKQECHDACSHFMFSGCGRCDMKTAICIQKGRSFHCECRKGFKPNQYGKCEDIDECAETKRRLCGFHAQCTNTLGSYLCNCDPGFYTIDGRHCRQEKSEAQKYLIHSAQKSPLLPPQGGFAYVPYPGCSVCHPNASCVSGRCQCLKGFFGDGRQCADVNECSKTSYSPCHQQAICENTIGSFHCRCKTNWVGNGFVCSQNYGQACLDYFSSTYRDQCGYAQWSLRYYFDAAMGKCMSFWYDNCNGTSLNFFPDRATCQMACGRHLYMEPSGLPPGPTKIYVDKTHQYSVIGEGKPEPTRTGAKEPGATETDTSASVVEYPYKNVTMVKPDSTAEEEEEKMLPTAIQDLLEICGNRCRTENTCETVRCRLPMDEGYNNAHWFCERKAGNRYYWDTISQQCVVFNFFGCGGNGNNFATKTDCVRTCQSNNVTLQRPENVGDCYEPMQIGWCEYNRNKPTLQFYYNPKSGTCESFYYNGCNGSRNRFPDRKICELTCGATKAPKSTQCMHWPSCGECAGMITQWFYNLSSGKCDELRFTGCGGNSNRFPTERECKDICIAETTRNMTLNTNPCFEPVDRGNCFESIVRYYFDSPKRECRTFRWTGCGGNRNNFPSRIHCERRCGERRAQMEDSFSNELHELNGMAAFAYEPVENTTGPVFVKSKSGVRETEIEAEIDRFDAAGPFVDPFANPHLINAAQQETSEILHAGMYTLNTKQCLLFHYQYSGNHGSALWTHLCLLETGGDCLSAKLTATAATDVGCGAIRAYVYGTHQYTWFFKLHSGWPKVDFYVKPIGAKLCTEISKECRTV